MPENQTNETSSEDEKTAISAASEKEQPAAVGDASPANPPPKQDQRGHTNWRMKGHSRR